MLESRKLVMKNVFGNSNVSKIHIPIAFTHIINNVQNPKYSSNSLVDITPLRLLIN